MNTAVRLISCFVVMGYLALGTPAIAGASGPEALRWAEEVHAAAGVSGGFVVHIGDIGERTAVLRTSDRYYIQGLSPDENDVREARDATVDGRIECLAEE